MPEMPANPNSLGDLPDWLTGILSDSDKAQAAKSGALPNPSAPCRQPHHEYGATAIGAAATGSANYDMGHSRRSLPHPIG